MSDDLTPTYVEEGQEFARDMTYLPDRITPDPVPQTRPAGSDLAVEPGRYRLVAAKACPWANRAIIVRRLLGLEDVISLGMPGPTHDSAAGPSTSTPTAATRCCGSPGCRRRSSPGTRTTRAASRCRRWSTSPPARWSPTTSRGSPTTSSSSGPTTTAPARRTCGRPTSARRWTRSCSGCYPRSDGVYRCGFAGSQDAYDVAYDGCSPPWTGSTPGSPTSAT